MAVDTIGEFLLQNDMTVYIVIFDRKAYQISGKLFADITEYIDDHYVGANTDSMRERCVGWVLLKAARRRVLKILYRYR